MTFTALHGAAAGAIVTGALVAFALHPSALAPHASPTPSLDVASNDGVLRERPASRATPASTIVYVAGAVVRPGMYALASDARAYDAVTKAGGFTHDADTVAVNLAAHVADGDEIAVPHLGDALPASSRAHHRASGRASKHKGRSGHRRRTPRTDDAPAQTVDLNTADESALEAIPGIGPTLATRIVEFREVNGPFATVDALADVAGITPSKFDEMAPYLTVGRP
jgi:competence protein ComEA